MERVIAQKSEKLPKPVRVEKTLSARYGVKINILACLWFQVRRKIDLMIPIMKKTRPKVALQVTKTPCYLSLVTRLQRTVNVILADFAIGLTSMQLGARVTILQPYFISYITFAPNPMVF